MGIRVSIGMLFIGMALGLYLPDLPEPMNMIKPYLGIIFLIVAAVFIAKA